MIHTDLGMRRATQCDLSHYAEKTVQDPLSRFAEVRPRAAKGRIHHGDCSAGVGRFGKRQPTGLAACEVWRARSCESEAD
jgi:hypothetical protein